MITVLVSPEELRNAEVTLSGSSYGHLFRARRVELGRRLRLVDGRGSARWARVANVERFEAKLEVRSTAPSFEPEERVDLIVSSPRSQRAAWLVEKATEVGAAAIRFVSSARSPRTYGEGTMDRLHRVASAAVQQCHRSLVPEISGNHPWTELESLLASSESRWLLDPEGAQTSMEVTPGNGSVVVIGPEGGWEADERADLIRLGCLPHCLGPRVLRVETAAIVACALLLSRGDAGGVKHSVDTFANED